MNIRDRKEKEDSEEPPVDENVENDAIIEKDENEEDAVDKDDESDTNADKDGKEDDDKAKDEKEDDHKPNVELRVEIQNDENEKTPVIGPSSTKASNRTEEELALLAVPLEEEITDPKFKEALEYIKQTKPESRLEIALTEALERKEAHIARITGEVNKLKAFISKRKQTYKRKRKDEGAPTRALSAYNIFVQDRFARLAKENEAALKSADSDAQLKRVPPANLVASTGNAWKELTSEEKVKYEERAKTDRKRYEEQMAQYQPPDKQANRKRNKTGYNMFFSAHVLRLKQSEMGVPSERGSVARLVGTAWKQLSAEEKQYYEREADKHNGMNPVEKEGDEDEEDENKRNPNVPDHYGHMHGHDMHMHGGMPPQMHPGMHQPAPHEVRHHGYAPYPPQHMYPPHGYYDYGHHGHPPPRHQQGRSQGYSQAYPPHQAPPYDNRGMQI